VPYLTPDSIPEESDCRSLLIPASTDWLAIVSGALTELTKTWNWQQFGSVTVEQAVEAMQAMIDQYYLGCTSCELPEGGSIIRIGDEGILEVLEGGAWVVPDEGDYYIPPPEAREGGTEPDQNCLAAKNAMNVLEQLYESLSESWGSSLSEAEALTDFVILATSLITFEFAPISFGIAAFFKGVFTLLYNALEYLGADLWDEAFSDQMTCFLLACASNDSGVVTFNWDCFVAQLNSLADGFGLSEVQLRLYLQVSYMLYFIGGVNGLNLAGATSEISDDDCDMCATHCHVFDFEIDDGGFVPGYPGFAPPAAYISNWVSGKGWEPNPSGHSQNGFYLDFDPIEVLDVNTQWIGGTGTPAACGNISIELYLAGTQVGLNTTTDSWHVTDELRISGSIVADRIIVSGDSCASTLFAFYRLEITYIGDEEFGGDNCS